MDLIFFLIGNKILNFFSWEKNKILIISFVLIFAGTFYNYYILILSMDKDLPGYKFEALVRYIFILVFILTVVRKFFPQFSKLSSCIEIYHPLNSFNRYLINVINEFISPFFLNAIFFCVLLMTSPNMGFLIGLKLAFLIILAIIFRRILQVIFTKKFLFEPFYLISILLLILSIIAANIYFPLFTVNFHNSDFIQLIVIILIGFIIEEKLTIKRETRNLPVVIGSTKLNILLNNSPARNSLVFSFITKIILLGSFFFSYLKNHEFEIILLSFIFWSPLIMFTYVFNNSWGLFRSSWRLIDQASGRGMDLFRFQLDMIKYPLIIDMIISGIFIILISSNYVQMVILYLVLLPLLIVLSFYFSVSFPFYVGKINIWKTNTSVVSSFILIFVTAGLLPAMVNKIYNLILPVYGLAFFLLYKNLNKFYSQKRITLFSALYKN